MVQGKGTFWPYMYQRQLLYTVKCFSRPLGTAFRSQHVVTTEVEKFTVDAPENIVPFLNRILM